MILSWRSAFSLGFKFKLWIKRRVRCSPQYAVTEPRKQAYADFYKQYDATKEFNAMREAGIFESVRPSEE